MGTPLRRWIPLSLLVVAAAAPAAAQRIDPDRVFEVTLEIDGRMMSAMIREGSSLRLTRPGGVEYHFSPVLRSASSGTVLMAVSRAAAGEPQQVVERLQLSVGVPVALRSAPTLRIVLDKIGRANEAQSTAATGQGAPAPFRFAALQTGSCCVCCEGSCACACGVSWWCGHCCTRGCCDPVEPTSNDRTPLLTGPARFASFTRRGACTRGSLLDREAPAAATQMRTALR
ncbi:MAG TPA: hypothetical protein VHG93_22360 [Longimicrobium sp.]|nr:hypothetical protein [Longimicrobium sp.]